MVKFLLYVLIVSLFLLDYLYLELGIGIRVMTWIPEMISIFIAVLIPLQTALNKDVRIPIKYSLLLTVYLIHLVLGFLLNDINGWVILSGTRIYTKFLPVFLAPIIFPLSKKEFKGLIIFIFVLTMAQLPVVLLQRFVFFAEELSGDPMGGTLGHSSSGILAIFMLSAMSFIIAFYYKEQISLAQFVIFFLATFIPVTLNETKITFLLLPVAFLIPSFFVQLKFETVFKIVMLFLLLFFAFFILKGIYDYFQSKRWGYGIQTFVLMPGRLQEYSNRRLDPIKYAFTYGVAEDVRFMVFGRGAGNASEGFTRVLEGKYLREASYYGVGSVSFTKLMWELGLFGTLLYFMFPFFAFLDGVRNSRRKGFEGAFSLGILAYSVFFFLSLFYTVTLDSNVLTYLFFLMAGLVAGLETPREEETAPGFAQAQAV